jgi:cytochrome d ubiquinol oxidase subunit I
MGGAVITASFVMASVGAFYLLNNKHIEQAKNFIKIGVLVGTVCTMLQIFPTGDQQGKMTAIHQPATLAAMEALFDTENGAPLVLVGQPNIAEQKLDNPIVIPKMLSFLTYQRWNAQIKGLKDFPKDQLPDNIPLLYYSYHIMVGLGTIFVAIMFLSAFLLWRGKLFESRWMLWILMLSFPFPYIANTAGWLTAELGRQPWLVYGLLRTSEGYSTNVSTGNTLFTLIGFMGLYLVLGILFLFFIWQEIEKGPMEEGK